MEASSRRISQLVAHLSVSNVQDEQGSLSITPTSGACPVKNQCPAKQSKLYPRLQEPQRPLRVLVTGAAGGLAYSLIFMIAKGDMFGPHQQIILHLLDIPAMGDNLKGVEMELIDGAFPLLREIVVTTDVKTAFTNVEVAILVGAFPRQKGMERKDLLKKNAAIFKEQGRALNDFAARSVKVVVVGNPANTNAYIAMVNAPSLPKENFTALTRLDHNRAKAQIAVKLGVAMRDIHNVVIWGNHSATQYPDVSLGFVDNFPAPGLRSNVRAAVNNDQWLHNDFLATVQQRGAAVIAARKSSSAASAAFAVVCHVRDWLIGTPQGEIVSMAVPSDGSYGVPKDIIFSFPVTTQGGNYTIVQGVPFNEFSQSKLKLTIQELLDERQDASEFLK